MLERYIEGFDADRFVSAFKAEQGGITKDSAMKILRRNIPKESYYQRKIKEALEARYGNSLYVRKISLGPYSEAGVADLMVVIGGQYIGLEVKRPVVGEPSKLQLENQRQVRAAGGVYEFVVWPEDAIAVVETFLKGGGRDEQA